MRQLKRHTKNYTEQSSRTQDSLNLNIASALTPGRRTLELTYAEG